ncbi:succinate dehydrogenase assembly factor 3, mitochondrial [Bradysia coprophila]|uniref:succinate dehydrogenase assembly factor 3, mitochondrial n=1 Tax=Bradysia coprophila TaxID=38358 RepID=UPI00187DBBB2|nr:succinate dehydrogenase assembly factor 3, mitochondrial [Bradysia coprophila]
MTLRHDQRVRLLYKTILRLHRGLPVELQPLGNSYAKDEFKRHKTCNPAEAQVFLVEWTNYAVQLSHQLGLGIKGRPKEKVGEYLPVNKLDDLREEQVVQLYELMKAATGETDDKNSKEQPDGTKS